MYKNWKKSLRISEIKQQICRKTYVYKYKNCQQSNAFSNKKTQN